MPQSSSSYSHFTSPFLFQRGTLPLFVCLVSIHIICLYVYAPDAMTRKFYFPSLWAYSVCHTSACLLCASIQEPRYVPERSSVPEEAHTLCETLSLISLWNLVIFIYYKCLTKNNSCYCSSRFIVETVAPLLNIAEVPTNRYFVHNASLTLFGWFTALCSAPFFVIVERS